MRRALPLLSFFFLFTACQPSEFGPVATPAAEHSSYARGYPAQLSSSLAFYDAEHNQAADLSSKFKTFPAALKDPSWSEVEQVYKLAVLDGKSAYYAKLKEHDSAVTVFFIEQKKEVVKKVNGGVHYQAKQEKCDVQFYGTIDRGLETGIEEGVKKREEAQSAAQLYISQHEESLGKKNAATLKEQAQLISVSAYLVTTLLAKHHQELTQQLSEENRVKKTISRRLKELEGARRSSESEAERDLLNAEHQQLLTARSELQAVVDAGKKRLQSSEQQVTAARDSFETQIKSLLDQVEKLKLK